MDTDDVKPGFTKLKLEYCRSTNLFKKCEQFGDKHYLSSTLWKQAVVVRSNILTIHGPCIFDKD